MRPSCSPELPAIKTWCREGHSKAQPRDYRSRALPLELSRRHAGVRRTDYFLFTKRAHRQQCLPGKIWSWRGESNPGFILTWFIVINDVSCPNWTTPAMWSWWSYSKTQPPRYECGALPLELHQRNMERATGLEPASGPWQGPILATGRRPHHGAEYESPTRLAGLEDQCLRRSANPA